MIAGKAILEFDMSDPDQQNAHEHATRGLEYWLAMGAFAEELRKKRKYAESGPKDWSEVEDLFHDTLRDHEVPLE